MVPGVDVAQINENTWAISVRGFNLQFANKLLVLIDGRSVYTPAFRRRELGHAGRSAYEDIDRIEVIRGRGGTIWGDNAVNGVINSYKTAAAYKKGWWSRATARNPKASAPFSMAGKWSKTGYRVFVKYLNTGEFPNLSGQDGNDDYHLLHGGFRADTKLSQKDSLTTQGDIYTGAEGATITHSSFTPPENVNAQRLADLSGGNILARWAHTFSTRCDTTFSFISTLTNETGRKRRRRNTLDLIFKITLR